MTPPHCADPEVEVLTVTTRARCRPSHGLKHLVGSVVGVPDSLGNAASVADLIGGLVGVVNSATGALVNASNDIDSFATATVSQLQRFRAGLAQTRVAVQTLRGTYDSLVISEALLTESADESQPFWDLQSAWAASSLESLRLLAAASREAAIAEQGTILWNVKGRVRMRRHPYGG